MTVRAAGHSKCTGGGGARTAGRKAGQLTAANDWSAGAMITRVCRTSIIQTTIDSIERVARGDVLGGRDAINARRRHPHARILRARVRYVDAF